MTSQPHDPTPDTAETPEEKATQQDILLDTVPVQVCYFPDAETYGYANRAHIRFLNKTKEELQRKSLRDIFPEENAEMLIDGNKHVFNSGQVTVNEEWIPDSTGELSLFSITRTPVFNIDGKVKHIVCTMEDITNRKLIEKVLKESEEIFRMISISAQDAIIMVDNSGLITHWNPAAEKILGYSEVEILGETLGVTLVPKRYIEEFNSVFSLWQERRDCPYIDRCSEFTVVRRDGVEINVEVSIASVELDGQSYVIGILRDITERKLMEELVKKQTEELIHTNQLLMQAKEDAEIANLTKGKFLANMSHEIRTPMNGVIGMTTLLMSTELTAEQHDYAETIRSSADSLLTVINDILDFSKIDAGKLILEKLEFDLLETVEAALDMLALKAHEKNLDFNCIISSEISFHLLGDPGRLRQIIINLCSNAIKFTEKGEVTIKVLLEKLTDKKVTIRFIVSDTGIGIPKNMMECLFNSFSQVDNSTTRKYGGTGLGLVISKRLAEMMGGAIGAESLEKRGSTFWFTAVFDRGTSIRREEIMRSEELRNLRILIVDDNDTNRFVFKEYLKSWGCRYDEASNAIQALVKFYQACETGDPFTMAFIDMQMPEMDGMTLALQIKNSTQLKDTTLLLLTSLDKKNDEAEIERLFSAQLTKPIKQASLLNTILKVMGVKKATELSEDRDRKDTSSAIVPNKERERYRILLAEDNYVNQKVAMGLLQKLGFRADNVGNGKEAIRALGMIPYDLVLMDLQMPEMDGFETTAFIRDKDSKVINHNVPVIAITAHSMKGDRERCLKAGMNNYVSKPFRMDEISRILDYELSLTSELKESIPTSTGEKKILDWDSIVERLDGDEDFAHEIIQETLNANPQYIEDLKSLLAADQAESLVLLAHSMKGVYANISAHSLRDLAYEIELLARGKKLNDIYPLIQKLEKEFEKLCTFVTCNQGKVQISR
ncbi:MAG: response regulator [Candidatus Xenobiia bacterium LiM19]